MQEHSAMYHELFPPIIIELQAEIQQHPELLIAMLQLPKDSPIELKMAEVATYCDMVLNGIYTEDDILKLAGIMINKMKSKRGELVLEIATALPANLLH